MDTRKVLGGKSKAFVSYFHSRPLSIIRADLANSTTTSKFQPLWLLFAKFVLFYH